MKHNKMGFFVVILLLVSIMAFSQDYNITPIVSDELTGVYMPISFIDELARTNNYYEAINIRNGRYYDLIDVKQHIIVGWDILLHQNIINLDEIIFINNNCQTELIDKNGYKYIRISDDFDTFRAYRDYVTNHFFSIIYNIDRFSPRQLGLIKMEEGFFFNEKRWRLALYVEGNFNFVYFYYNSNREREYIGIRFIENKVLFYNLESIREYDFPLLRIRDIILLIE
jgi:hypothetical protein